MDDHEPCAAVCEALSDEQRTAFHEQGHVRLRAAYPREVALRIQANMWAELLEDFGIDESDRGTWYQPRRSLRRAKWDPLQAAIATDVLVGAIAALLRPASWRLPTNWGAVLITFPNRSRDDWGVPSDGWHYDFDAHENATSVRGLTVFTFFSTVEPRGGGTLIVEGSHLLLRRFVSSLPPDERRSDHQALRRRFLRHDPWLRALTGVAEPPPDRIRRFMQEGEAGTVPLRVVELTGDPGDVILCHPLMLHVSAQNGASVPRFMRSQRICAEGPNAERRC